MKEEVDRIKMRYMLLVYSLEADIAYRSVAERQSLFADHTSVMTEAASRGIFRAAEPLKPTSTATTVRMQDGQRIITDGPFAETKEQLAGYYIVECKDLDEAIDWAAKIPTACKSDAGAIEIRPIAEFPQSRSPDSLRTGSESAN